VSGTAYLRLIQDDDGVGLCWRSQPCGTS